MLYMTGKALFGPLKEPPHTPDLSAGLSQDLNPREIAILAPLAVLVVALGLAPRLITDTLDPALQQQVMTRIAAAQNGADPAIHAAVAGAPSQQSPYRRGGVSDPAATMRDEGAWRRVPFGPRSLTVAALNDKGEE
jgi:hypothetical protein